jgi:chromosome segregation protein
MYLKELTINGFKSFAKAGDFEFSTPITGIVGPNGSGKSNVAESFRFVLGEQSVKSMRGKKGEDLIWGGSDKLARGNRAAVEVVFDNRERNFALDFDEVKIERVVHRDGQNEYKINGSNVRLKDVHELLAGANIGSTGHHIISQGEADRVLSAGPKERREMIEDALGLKVYQLKKQEADRKLSKTTENIAQVESLRREAAPHLRYLKKQVERAERSLEVQSQLKTSYAEYLRREDTYLAKHHDRLMEEKIEPQKQQAVLQDKIAAAKKLLDSEKEQVTENTELAKAKTAAAEAAANWQIAQNELSQLQGQVQFLERKLAASEQQLSKPKKLISHDELAALVESLTKDAEAALKEGGNEALSKALTSLSEKLKTFLREAKGESMPEVIDTSELDELRKDIEKKTAAANELKEKKRAADATVSDIQTSEVTELQEKRETEKALFELLQEQRDTDAHLSHIEQQLAVLERDRQDFKLELQEAVTLVGRDATQYFSYQIKKSDESDVTEAEIVNEDRDKQRTRRRELEKLKIRLEELGMGATDDLIKEFEEAKARDEFLAKELADLETSVGNLETLIKEMQEKLEAQFFSGVDKITKEFNTFFTLMFGGGSAKLDRVKIKKRASDDEAEAEVVEEGVELNVSLPNKRVKGLEMLSGGERALTSIALIFAMSQVNPPPFIILDETDAALDEANSRRYGDMIEALAKKSQLVLITHNRETMSRAGILYGITMGADGVSKVLSVKFDEAIINAK